MNKLRQSNSDAIEEYKISHLETVDELKRKIVHIETMNGFYNPQPKIFNLLQFRKSKAKKAVETKEIAGEKEGITILCSSWFLRQ